MLPKVAMFDLRTRTALFCAALALAIAASVALRARYRSSQLLFAAFAANVGLWYLTQGLFGMFPNITWGRATELLAVLLPQLAVRLFVTIVPREPILSLTTNAGTGAHPKLTEISVPLSSQRLVRVATACALPMLALVASPMYDNKAARVLLFVYFAGFTGAALFALAREGAASKSRAIRQRSRFLAVFGALATVFSLADFLWFLGAPLPPVGAVLSIVFLFVLAQSFQSERLLDLYDMAGRLMVATALAFLIGWIFWVFVWWVGRYDTMYLNAVLASIAILVLLGPLQQAVEERIHMLFFRERIDLESALVALRQRLGHVLEPREMVDAVLGGLDGNRRITSASIYLREGLSEPGGAAYLLEGHLGATPKVLRIEEASARTLLVRLGRGAVVREEVEREVSAALQRADVQAVGESRDLYERLVEVGAGVVIGIGGEELAGILVLNDDRLRDAFSPEEVKVFEGLAGQMATVLENTRAYARVKERDRLTALGAMAAGLAHEVKNPLGAIKGAAQILAEQTQADRHEVDPEFVGIILEEVERLDRVVSSILDYARPRADEAHPIDVNAAVRRTMQILAPAHDEQVQAEVALVEPLPTAKIDPEQLRQVLMNLVKNAVQAMGGRGQLTVSTAYRRASRDSSVAAPYGVVEVRVADTGPGISNKVLKNLFVPFFTTKSTGTGLGLAISQRIVQNAGGVIDVQSSPGVGTAFTIVLPASVSLDEAPASSQPVAAKSQLARA
jgi:two-component system sensor histidine kinase HydH